MSVETLSFRVNYVMMMMMTPAIVGNFLSASSFHVGSIEFELSGSIFRFV